MNREHRWNQINGMKKGEKIFLLGSGTSLKGFDLGKLKDCYVIAINHSIEHYPQADALIFNDKIFMKHTTFDLDGYRGLIFASEKCKDSKPFQDWGERDNLYFFNDNRDTPILNAKTGLYHPTSTGMSALNLALQMRARRIFLLGYDYYTDGDQRHFFEDYPHHKKYPIERIVKKLRRFRQFEKYKDKIVNCNRDSLIKAFPKHSLSEVFNY